MATQMESVVCVCVCVCDECVRVLEDVKSVK